MSIILRVIETLIWHDIPQLFVAEDMAGAFHLGLAVEHTEERPKYITVAISPSRLQLLKEGKIDLHSIFAQPEKESWFHITSYEDDRVIIEPMPELKKIPKAWLPVPGEFLPARPFLRPDMFDVLKVSAIAKEANMNPSLLRQYLSGVKRPTPEQARQIQEALHRVGKRLLEVRMV